jgi:site-specific DNA-methyltransferase (adenine-specific)
VSASAWKNQLYFGDNLKLLRDYIGDEAVDLVYLDPPFNSKATYNVLFQETSGEKSAAQIEAFDDTWHWGLEAESTFHDLVTAGPKRLADLMQALRTFLGQNDMMAYLTMMAARLVELHRVLNRTGSIYLHCDPTASHYLKLVMDAVFGADNFRNEVVWKRTSAHSSAKRYGPVHDVLLFYTKSQAYTWNEVFQELPADTAEQWYNNVEPGTGRRYNRADLTAPGVRAGPSGAPWRGIDPTSKGRHWAIPGFVGELVRGLDTQAALDALDAAGRLHWPKRDGGVPMLKRYLDESHGIPAQDVITDIYVNNVASERLGYPTQKPIALLERIIRASSNEGDVVLDPFCGCGTAVVAAERLHRRWIGMDITHLAITLIRRRLEDTFASELSAYEVLGNPKDLAGAQELAKEDRHQFEWWALDLVGARPAQDKRKGSDRGIDGYINFFDDNTSKAKTVIVQVKSGHVSVDDVRVLRSVVDRERAVIGLLVTLREPTAPMRKEAAGAGFYEPQHLSGVKCPRIQILTIADLLNEVQPQYPRSAQVATFKRAKRTNKAQMEQGRLI